MVSTRSRRSQLGRLLLRRDDVDGAIRELEKAIELDPGATAALYNLGQALRPACYDGPLCPICFTAFELEMSAAFERTEQALKNGERK